MKIKKTMTSPILELKDVSLNLDGHKILHNINFRLYPREIMALIGLNGSGKTTLLKVILGTYKITSGKLIRDFKQIGYVPQKLEFEQSIPLSVIELLKIYSHHQNEKKIKEKLREVQAENLINKQIGKLSGGELQRVLIANALLQNPDLLLLDEATSGIDIAGEKNFYQIIANLHKIYPDIAIIIVSHDIHTVFSKATKVLCLHHQTCCHGSPQDIAKNPQFKEIFSNHLSFYEHHHY
ncbi:hypothetical protein A2229_03810 [Candidatus Peregrinibacteria bacterium RIFOXYA2_FULL_33_7]|nr:MAG: hypothetical protein A2229_03810 [Candidatus Peregrinibacteria bacterium RIFOXYA2_FULL_33_7]